jgi:diguanylate cyclase (GGDEF)-like protein
VLAAVVARLVTRPINSISHAVQRFGTDQQIEVPELRRRDELGALARSFAKMQYQITTQIRALAQSHQELELLARHDPLTGLPNRRYFQERLDDALARALRSKTRFAILFIDVDKFKAINDQYGHEAGDEVLKAIAIRLQANTRKVDTVARMGGDEFVVLLDSTDNQQAIELTAEKLLENVLKPIPWLDQELEVGLSVGISQFPDNGRTAHELLSSADHAMYRVKSGGQSGFQFAESNFATLG